MWLNITAAKVICAMCIGIGTWLVHQANPNDVVIRSPLEPADVALAADEEPAPAEAPLGGSREALVRRFDRPNAMDRQAQLNLETGTVYVRNTPAPDQEPIDLPPLLLPQPESLAVAAAPPAAGAAVPAPVAEVELAVADATPPAVEFASAVESAASDVATVHRVAKGERLVRVAQRYYGSTDARCMDALLDANPNVKARQGRLLAGESIRVPALGGKSAPPTVALAATAIASNSGATLATPEPRWYTIQSKDSLSGIAQRFLSDPKRWPEIVKLNQKLDPKKIVPGMRIKLPPAIAAASR